MKSHSDAEKEADTPHVFKFSSSVNYSRSDIWSIDNTFGDSHFGATEEAKFMKIFTVEKVSKVKKSCLRRDVINKSILRHFHKYLRTLCCKNLCLLRHFLSQKGQDVPEEPSSEGIFIDQLGSFDTMLETWKWRKKFCTVFGELDIEWFMDVFNSLPHQDREMSEFILWASIHHLKNPHNHFKVDKFEWAKYEHFIKDNEAINILSKILKNYSHSSLQKVFDNKTLRLFLFHFIEYEKEPYLVNFISENKRTLYRQALEDFSKNLTFSLYNLI
jgi:hypothetical protein